MKKEIKKSNSGTVKAVVLGTSLAGLAASAYFMFTEKGKKNQKYAKAWAIKMKGDVVEKLETAREVSEPIYHKIIDSVAAKHEKIKKDGPKEVKELANDLKKHWNTISGLAAAKPEIKKPTAKKSIVKAKPVKKVVKKAIKKK